jgi:Protein of unknown function (DUF2961)
MKPRPIRSSRAALRALAAVFLAAPALAPAQAGPEFSSPLSNLAAPREGRAMHEGSWDRKHQNDDALHVKPGQTVTLFTHEGAGTVHRFWVTIAPREDVAVLSQAILRMYWDGDTNPSVECPVGAFFGVGFGEQKDFISMPLDETSGGYNCYWPMPFHKSARWTLTNGAARPIDSFYYNIDYTALDSLPADTRHFHAQFRRENPTTAGRNYTILETEGAGHYVGTALFMAGKALYFLEGNEMVYIDGATVPSIEGTGTEDYFSSGWYFDRGVYSAPYHGVIIKDEARSRVSAYRWHIEDAIPFTRSIRFTIEHGTGNNETADYSSVAYYYLAGPSPAPAPLPADLLPSSFPPMTAFAIPGAVEAEDLVKTAKATAGGVWAQDMGNWDYGEAWSKRGSLFWKMDQAGADLTVQLPAAADGKYEVTARMVSGPSFASVQFSLGGRPLGAPADLYSPQIGPREVTLGEVDLKAGSNPLTVSVTGKNERAGSFTVGIDAFLIKPSQ